MESISQSDLPKVFICHNWKNKKVACRVEAELKSAGLNVWVDHSEVVGGDVIPEGVSEAIEACDILVLIWSRAAKRSEWVKREWTAAVELGKKIIALRLDRTKLPVILMGSAHIQASIMNNGIADLTKAISGVHPNSKKRTGFPLKLYLGISGLFVLIILLIIAATPNSVFEIEVLAKRCSFALASDASDEEEVSLLFSGIWTNSVSYENVQPIELFVIPHSNQLQITNPITITPDPSNGRITFASNLPVISIQDITCSANSKVALQLTNRDLIIELQDGSASPYHYLSLADTVNISVQNCSVTDGRGKDLSTTFKESLTLQLQDFSRSLTLYGQDGDLVAIIKQEETKSYEQPHFLHVAQIRDLNFDKSIISSASSVKQSTIDSVSISRSFPSADISLHSDQPGDLDLSAEPNYFVVTNLSIKNDLIVMNMQGRFKSLKLTCGATKTEMVPGLFSLITQYPKLAIYFTVMVWLAMFAGLYLFKRLREKW